jgi:hypothetical protein
MTADENCNVGTGNVRVTGTSGSLSHSATFVVDFYIC